MTSDYVNDVNSAFGKRLYQLSLVKDKADVTVIRSCTYC